MDTDYKYGQNIIRDPDQALGKTADLLVCRAETSGNFFYANNHGIPVKVLFNDGQRESVQAVTDDSLKLTAIKVKIRGFEKDRVPVAELIEVGKTVKDCPI